MKRLTIRNSDGSVSQPTNTTIEDVFHKLAEYEDTEMTPEEVEQMKIDLCNAEAELLNEPDIAQEYSVEITEYAQKVVTVIAHSKEEALRIAKKGWENGDYILDADNFKGIVFDAKCP